MKRIHRCLIAGAVTLAVAGACSSGATSLPASNAAKTSPSVAKSGSAVATGDDLSPDKIAWGVKYVGGKPIKPDASLPPVKIGWVNQDGGPVSQPESTDGAKAAVSFVNDYLGGVQGHPVQLVACSVTVEEDGQRCGTQFMNDKDVTAIAQGILVAGNQSLYSVVNGQKPDFVATLNATQDFTAKNVFSYYIGSPTISQGLSQYMAKDLKAKSVAVVYVNTAAAAAAAERSKTALQTLYGVSDVKLVAVPTNATGPAVASALQAVGADKADVLYVRATVQACIAIVDGMQTLGITTPVVTPITCMATPLQEHLNGSFPRNWYFSTTGYNSYVPDLNSGMASYRAVMKKYKPTTNFTGYAPQAFGTVMSVVKLMNEVGYANLSPDAITTAAKAFTGPGAFQAGDLKCGYNPSYPNECGQAIGIANFSKGRWVSVRGGIDNNAIFPWQR
jgi:branched-chain amino acid transport system substrate-binding protein